jgi:hypothetical protein
MFDRDLITVIAVGRSDRADDRSASAVSAWEWRPAALRPALLSDNGTALLAVPRNRQETEQWRKEQPATRISFGNYSHNEAQNSQRNIFLFAPQNNFTVGKIFGAMAVIMSLTRSGTRKRTRRCPCLERPREASWRNYLATSANGLMLKSAYEPHRKHPEYLRRSAGDFHSSPDSVALWRKEIARVGAWHGSSPEGIPES